MSVHDSDYLRRLRSCVAPGLVCALGLLGAIGSARAAGFEAAPIGARDGGRGGASVVGADSAMGLFYNPATLLAAPGVVDVALALHTHLGELCFARTAVSENEDGTRSGGERSPKVCSGKGAGYLPEAATSLRFGEKQRFAVALGVSVPLPRSRNFSFGDAATATVPGPGGRVPAPSRYLLVDENIIQVFPTIGAAYEPHRQIRVGASFGWGVTSFDFSQVAYSRVVVLPPDTVATSDIAVRSSGVDGFTPRFQLGTVLQPVAAWPLWLALTFSHTGDIRVDDAKLRLRGIDTQYATTNALIAGALANTPPPEIAATVSSVRVEIPQTSTLSGGIRYAQELRTPVDLVGDRLSKERFDLELNVIYTFSKRVDTITAALPPTTVRVPSPSVLVADVNLPLPDRFDLPQRWKNQIGLRLGGDYNVLPGRLALRAGVQYESSGIRHGYEQLMFLPAQQWGLSCGLTVRILRQLDASLAYSHFFIRTQDVSPRRAQQRRQVSGDPLPGDDQIVNAGSFSQRLDTIAMELATRF